MQNSIWLVSFNGNFGHDKLKRQKSNGAVQHKGFCAHYLSIIPSIKPSNLRTSALEPDCLGSNSSLSTFRYIFLVQGLSHYNITLKDTGSSPMSFNNSLYLEEFSEDSMNEPKVYTGMADAREKLDVNFSCFTSSSSS